MKEFENKLVEFRNISNKEKNPLPLGPSGEIVTGYYVSLKEIFGDDYWNRTELPIWFINNVLEEYSKIASNWLEIAKTKKIVCSIILRIYDPNYISSDLTIINAGAKSDKQELNNLLLPSKFKFNNIDSFIWELNTEYDELSWKLHELSVEEMKALKEKGYEMEKMEDKYYKGEIYEVGDMIFRKRVGDIWIGKTNITE